MQLTNYNRFFDLFQYLHAVVFAVMTKTTENKDNYTVELRNNLEQIMPVNDDFEGISFDEIIGELKQVLYTLTKENKESFIVGILQSWIQHTPFFDINNKREIYRIKGISVNTNTEFYHTAKSTIKKNELLIAFFKASIFEKYIVRCYQRYNEFFNQLSDLLHPLDIDFNSLMEKVATPPHAIEKKDYSELLTGLKNYIGNISDSEFNNIINHHSLSKGTPKAIWTGTPADAHRFATYIKMTLPNFNKCFSFKDMNRILKHNDKNISDSAITDILKKKFDIIQ